MKPLIGALALAIGALMAGAASADPCEAALPRAGAVFTGVVRYVGDGDSLCVEVGSRSTGATWVEVRLADFNAPELSEPDGRWVREALVAVTMGQTLRCRAGHRSWDRIVSYCTLRGAPIGDMLRNNGVPEGGN